MWRSGSTCTVTRRLHTTCCKAMAQPVSRRLPSGLHISSPPLSTFPASRPTLPQRTATICGSTPASLQAYDKTTPGGGRRQLSDVVDNLINLPWQKIASWASVALLASQLQDFLGVRCTLIRHHIGFCKMFSAFENLPPCCRFYPSKAIISHFRLFFPPCR